MDAFDFQWRVLTGVRRVKEKTERTLHPICERHNVTPVQLRILMTLQQEGSLTVSNLARRSCMADANNSALCKRLAQQGLVTRCRAKEDERHVLVSLTPQGKAVLREINEICEVSFQAISDRFDVQDIAQILDGLERLMVALEEEKENAS